MVLTTMIGLVLTSVVEWTLAPAPHTHEDPPFETYMSHPIVFINPGDAAATFTYSIYEEYFSTWVREGTYNQAGTPPWSTNYATLPETSVTITIPAGSKSVPAQRQCVVRRPFKMDSGSESWVPDGATQLRISRSRVTYSHNGDVYYILTPIGGSGD